MHGMVISRPIILAQLSLLAVVSYAFCNNGQTWRSTTLRQSATLPFNNTVSKQPPPKRSIHLISLPPKDDTFSLPAESLIRECWKWKDSVLGDGRDYFVPRPKSLKAFHSLFVGMEIIVEMQDDLTLNKGRRSSSTDRDSIETIHAERTNDQLVDENIYNRRMRRTIKLCSFRSSTKYQSDDVAPDASTTTAEQVARTTVAFHLLQQIQSHRSQHSSFLQMSGLASWLDLPDAVNTLCMNSATNVIQIEESTRIMQLSQRLTCIEGARPISTHLSLIASGIAPRTNRPDREVIFRPYSSRDAHILLQLKRTAEVVSTLSSDKRGGGACMKILLDSALSAGKAARNEQIVPEIRKLKEFGSDGTPPIGLAKIVAEAAVQMAVNPTVDTCVARLNALGSANNIYLLRQRVNDVVDTLVDCDDPRFNKQDLQRVANELLHAPTMQLRSGEMTESDMEDAVKNIEADLKAYCASQSKLVEYNTFTAEPQQAFEFTPRTMICK
ncbi:hypothetical protein ACHAWO_002440 [Cyclotella atomus]|uniref:Uncharacterized protein n=1 Tax=Cyclotella atomus TaxID=382360 RepID=A0ABD3QVF8_9STRA